jgi:ketosteroid isomerase-like protein
LRVPTNAPIATMLIKTKQTMRFTLIILLLHHFLFGYAQSGSTEKILASELRRFDAMVRKDTTALQQLIDDDLIYVHSNSLKEDKKQHISAITTGKIVYEQMTREDATVHRYGKIAVVNGKVRVKGFLEKTGFDIKLAYLAIYKSEKRHWRLVNWQSTRVP